MQALDQGGRGNFTRCIHRRITDPHKMHVAGETVVLLTDEIDKADLEFPNDLLWELDIMNFYIPETRETVTAKKRPVVIITSNAEKELPDAFLRRCIFHYIEFPDTKMMEKIIKVPPAWSKRSKESAGKSSNPLNQR